MEPAVQQVQMYPKQGGDAVDVAPRQSANPQEPQIDQAPRTSAIPLPDAGQLRNRKQESEQPREHHNVVSDTTSPAEEAASRATAQGTERPNADLVLLFNTPKSDAPQVEQDEANKEFSNLLRKLHSAGLLTSSTAGADDSNQRLVFIKAVQSAVRSEAQSERFADWLRVVRAGATRDDLASPRDFQEEPLAPAERIRLVAGIVEKTIHPNPHDPATHQAREHPSRIEAYFPLHNEVFNERWLQQWSKAQISIPDSQLSDIRDNLGDGVALYFEFLRYYFKALAFPAFVGLSTWLGGHYFSKLYSFTLVVWSILFVESWRIQERKLSVQWGTYGISKDDVSLRPGFKTEGFVTSPITGQQVPYSPWWLRESRMLAGIPAVLGFAVGLAVVICCIFSVEIIIGEVYHGPGKQFLSLLPLVGYAGVVPQIVSFYHQIAKQLTDWENHPSRVGHERALTLKMFVLNAIVSYGVLTLTAYVYLPFATFVVPFLTSSLRTGISESTISAKSLGSGASFSANPHRLTNTLFALMTTTQAIGAFTEVALPYLQERYREYKQEQVAAKRAGTSKKESTTWLDDVRLECTRPAMEVFNEYAEMVIQFGHVVLFSTAWPLAPVAALINNFIELRGDAFKLCTTLRRPVPTRADSIGPWLDALTFISYLGALTNASLVYLMRSYPVKGHLNTAANTVQEALQAVGNATHTKTLPPARPFSAVYTTRLQEAHGDSSMVWNTLLGALLCALASEHGFVLVRAIARHLFERILWQGSKEEAYVKGMNWHLRKDYIESQGGQNFEKEIVRLDRRRQQDHDDVMQGESNNTNLINADFWRNGNGKFEAAASRKRQ